MVRVKTRYKRFAAGGAVDAVAPPPASPEVIATADIDVPADRDDASVAFQHQIDALRQAEGLQRQRQAPPPPLANMSPEQREALWKREGIGDDDIEHFNNLLEYPAITIEAVRDANRQGLNPDSAEFHRAVRDSFESRFLSRLEAPPEINPVEETLEQARRDVTMGQEFEPTAVPLPEPSRRNAMVSAPVSRETAANGGYNSYGERPGQVTMTPAMKEAARIAGISEREYAANVLRLRQEKSDGLHGGQP